MLNCLFVPMIALIRSLPLVPVEPGTTPPARSGIDIFLMIATIVAFFLVTLFPGVLMIVAAVKMKRLRAYWLAVVAGILAVVLSPAGFFVGLPIGIWALVVLSQRDVRTAFGHRRQKSRPILKTVVTIAIVVAIAIGACVAAREAMYLWQLSQIPKQARIASIERRYRRQLDKLAECAFDYDHFKSVTRREGDEVSRLFADPAIVEATVYNSNDENKGGIGLKSGEPLVAPGSSCWFCRSPSIGNPVLNLWTRGDHQFVEYCACLLDRTGVERSYTILFDPSKIAEAEGASATIAVADNGPIVELTASYPGDGVNAQLVADTVAAPIEQQVNGVEWMARMESESRNDGTYIAYVRFRHNIDAKVALTLVKNRVALAKPILPEKVQRVGVTVKALAMRESDNRVTILLWIRRTGVGCFATIFGGCSCQASFGRRSDRESLVFPTGAPRVSS